MSLKAFHVFFISVSVLLCGGFAWWCLQSDYAIDRPGYKTAAIASIVIGIGLVIYEINFLRKFKNNE